MDAIKGTFSFYKPFSEAEYNLLPVKKIWQAQRLQALQYQLELNAAIYVNPEHLATFKNLRNSEVDLIYYDRKEVLSHIFPDLKVILTRSGKHGDRLIWKIESGKRGGADQLDQLIIDVIHDNLT